MRAFLLLASLLTSASLYAMPCPGNDHMIDTYFTVEQVKSQCGEPVASNEYQKTTNTTEEWVYYIKNHNTNDKVTFLITRGRVQNINIANSDAKNTLVEQNLSSATVCGRIIRTGENANYIRTVCGNPATQKIISGTTVNVTELTYNGTGRNKLVFEDNKLIDWVY